MAVNFIAFFYSEIHYTAITGFLIIVLVLSGCNSQHNLEWNEREGYRWAELKTGIFGSSGFEALSTSKTGIDFSNPVSQENIEENRHYLNGSGVAIGDINGNGLPDIYFASLEGPNRLYENLGNYRFRDITREAGVTHEGYNSTGVVFADVNGNDHLDLLITSLTGSNALYLNDGSGRFTYQEESGLGESRGAKTMTLADINGNGFLDLYITNYNLQTARDLYSQEELLPENVLEMRDGEMRIIPPFDQFYTVIETAGGPQGIEIGESDELYINKGNGTFEKANPYNYFFDQLGNPVGLPPDWGLTARFHDITKNGFPDLYVANDFSTPDRFWINQGDGSFRAIKTEAIRNMSHASMGIDFSDINRNGYIDFVVTEMLSMEHKMRLRQHSDHLEEYQGRPLYNRNSVYLNRGDTTFAEIAYYSGLEASEWSWATYFMDVNLNGYEDLIVANGFKNDAQDMDTYIGIHETAGEPMGRGGDEIEFPPLRLQNKIFKNNGDLTFTDMSSEWGFSEKDISMGMALADLNNNGTFDLVINRFDDEAKIFRNKTNAPRIAVRLKGDSFNSKGIGAKIQLEGGANTQSKQIISGGNYLSNSQTQAVFAADGDAEHTLTVKWTNGRISVVNGVQANRIYEISQAEALPVTKENPTPHDYLFEDQSEIISHVHHENSFNDFSFGPLLPQKLSTLGPGLAWFDINGNGLEDLLIGSGKDGKLSAFTNNGKDSFVPLELKPLTTPAPGDQTTILAWLEDGKTRIIIGSANFEQRDPNVPSAFIYTIDRDKKIEQQEIPGVLSTTGPIAAADYTGNGYVDLFVGGRHKPGQYPVDADSRLFRNENGVFIPDEKNSQLLSGIGLVTDALFVDMNRNGQQDLLISTEWGTLKLFENRDGNFTDITKEVGLSNYKGWWNGIATGDFTNNGLPDIVALNIGLNSAYQLKDGRPLRMYYDDFNWDGWINILETYYSEEIGSYVPRRKLHDFESIPTILQNVRSHTEFSTATIDEIFDLNFSEVPYKEINTLEHMIFINNEGYFEPRPLPAKAQFSRGFYAGVADFDNDGNEDLFISQNFFGFPKNTPRLDSGRGLILKGDGKGNFEVLSGKESGIRVYGEQRGAALADLNKNGKTDIALSQNNDITKLFLNRSTKAGIRVSLKGPSSNENGVGSSIRLIYPDGKKGPSRTIQSGGGYLSQNSYHQVMGYKVKPLSIEVTWFDGHVTKSEYIEGKTEYLISYK